MILGTSVTIKSSVKNECYNEKIVLGTSVTIKSSVENECCCEYNRWIQWIRVVFHRRRVCVVKVLFLWYCRFRADAFLVKYLLLCNKRKLEANALILEYVLSLS
jgi:hypothetical protein